MYDSKPVNFVKSEIEVWDNSFSFISNYNPSLFQAYFWIMYENNTDLFSIT